MPNWQDQLSDDTDSSYSDTTFLSKDSDAIDLTFSDYESGYVPSETSVDRAFVASDTDALSYTSDNPSEEGQASWGLGEGIVEDIEDVSSAKQKKNFLTDDWLQPLPLGEKKPVKTISKKMIYCNGQQETHFLVLWYSWEKRKVVQ
ncbi:unnamed protein product [Penicillium camemberti]|uniref:Str. FM013 n=1 Tax=Penicillium camemberti (strain FM 013) TaxID=1429867 RepID=A0A0G4PUG3_PENC3|nr:unnamed protein product [Penicillium camemberti]